MSDDTSKVGVTTPPARTANPFTGSSTGEVVTGNAVEGEVGTTPPVVTAPTAVVAPVEDDDGDVDTDPKQASITLSEEAFASRLERAKRQAQAEARAALLRELKIADPKDLEGERTELQTLREKQAAAEREKLTKEQQLAADLEAERAKRAALENQLREVKTSSVYDKQDSMIQSIGLKHINPDFWKYARADFVEHVQSLTPQQTARFGEKDIERWFVKFAREKPAFATPKAPPGGTDADVDEADEKPKVRRRPITTAKPAARVAAPPSPSRGSQDPAANPEGKTFRPGQPNSMSKHEVNAELKRRGINSWR